MWTVRKTFINKGFSYNSICGKIKFLIIVISSGKKCYFVSIYLGLTQIPDNDRISWRIRGYIRCKRPLSVPGRVKKQMPEEESMKFVINRGFEKCLSLYPIKNWEPLFTDISKLNDFDPKVREFRRYFLNGATIVEPDSAGRLLVPPNLKEHAGLEKDIVLVSAVNKVEIWDSDKYKQFFDSFSPETFSSLAKEVMSKDGN